jgi:hypothetical protein
MQLSRLHLNKTQLFKVWPKYATILLRRNANGTIFRIVGVLFLHFCVYEDGNYAISTKIPIEILIYYSLCKVNGKRN